jgi:hypothetical protein
MDIWFLLLWAFHSGQRFSSILTLNHSFREIATHLVAKEREVYGSNVSVCIQFLAVLAILNICWLWLFKKIYCFKWISHQLTDLCILPHSYPELALVPFNLKRSYKGTKIHFLSLLLAEIGHWSCLIWRCKSCFSFIAKGKERKFSSWTVRIRTRRYQEYLLD